MSYSEQLKSPKWQKKRLEVLSRDNFTCCSCGDTETELQVHHLKYDGKPYESELEDMETLCWVCHYYETFEHKQLLNDFSIDPELYIKNHKTKNMLISEFSDSLFLYSIDFDNKKIQFLVSFWKKGEGIELINNLTKNI